MNNLKVGLIFFTLIGALGSFIWFLEAHDNNRTSEATAACMLLFGTTYTCGYIAGKGLKDED